MNEENKKRRKDAMKERTAKYIEEEKEEEAQMKLDPTKRAGYQEKPKANAALSQLSEEKKVAENPDLDAVASDADKDEDNKSEDGEDGKDAAGKKKKKKKEEKEPVKINSEYNLYL